MGSHDSNFVEIRSDAINTIKAAAEWLDSAEIVEEDGVKLQRVFVGTTTVLLPNSSHPSADDWWFEAAQATAERLGAFLTGGPDPCDQFLERVVD